jgi:serine/threonine-protein kinase
MIGERIGNYVVTQQLGEGGMGAVYLAEHPQIGKRVALKVLHAELAANQDITTRFFHEAKAVNDIGHPNIVDILDFGTQVTASGPLVYLVMELLNGHTLTSVIEQGPLDPARATQIALQVADALGASHATGIVHRDLKPDNIMLITRGREEQVKLLDFGIAKITAGPASTKTRTGMVMGTPTYMSPEQCEGRGNIDHRTDIYALGIVVYEMLTGRVPFSGSGYGEILVKQMTEAPAPPSTVRPGIPPHLELVVLKALQKRPEDRYATMQELASALAQPEQYINGHGGASGFLPIASAPPTAATVMVGVTPAGKTGPTTLSASAGQMTPVPASPYTVPPVQTRSKLPLVLGGVGAVAVAGVIAAVALRGGSSKQTSAADQPTEPTTEQVASGTTEAPPPARAPAPAEPEPAHAVPADPPAPPPPPPRTIKLSVATTPKGAAVYVADEKKPRCKTPCDVEATRADEDATLTVKLAGYEDLERSVRLNVDQVLELALEKKVRRHHTTVQPKETKPRPIGDNTLNPFEN